MNFRDLRIWAAVCALVTIGCVAPTPQPELDAGSDSDAGVMETMDAGMTVVMGDTCAAAIAIEAGTHSGSTLGATRNYSPECTGYPNPAPEVVYRIVVPAAHRLVVQADAVDAGGHAYDPSLYLLTEADCASTPVDAGAMKCLAGSDASNTSHEELSWLNATEAERVVFLVVDSYRDAVRPGPDGGVGAGPAGPFTLQVKFDQPTLGDTCAVPNALEPGMPLTGLTLSGFTNDYDSLESCLTTAATDRAFKVSVPAKNVLTVTAVGSGTLDLLLSGSTSSAACGVTCAAVGNSTAAAGSESIIWKNVSDQPADFFVVVDAVRASANTFSIVAKLTTPGADDICEGATVLMPGAALTGQTTVGYANDYALQAESVGCAASGFIGPDRAYAFEVPSQRRATVTITPTPGSGFNPSLNLLDQTAAQCNVTPRVCSTGANTAGANQPESISIFNTDAAAKRFFAMVDSANPLGGTYDVQLIIDEPAADDRCVSAMSDLPLGTATRQEMVGFTPDYGSVGANCLPALGPDRTYRVTVPPAQKLNMELTPVSDAGIDAVVGFIAGPASSCEALPRTCLGGIDFSVRGQIESGGIVNEGTQPLELFVVVADYERVTADRSFDLTASLGPIPDGESCAKPIVVAGAQRFATQSLRGASSDVSFNTAAAGSCLNGQGLPDQIYEITVPANATFKANAIPQAGVNLALNLIEGSCRDVKACLANANAGGAGAAETLQWANTANETKTVRLMVFGIPQGGYSLDLTLQ